MSDTETTEKAEKAPRKRKADTKRVGLRQIETTRRRREPLATDQTESFKTRERNSWTPQSEPSGVTEAV